MKFKRGGADLPSTPSNNDKRVGPDGTPIDHWIEKKLSNGKQSNCGPNGTYLDTYGKACKEKEEAKKRRPRSPGNSKKRRINFNKVKK